MFAVFYKNEFKGLWHNPKDDKDWLKRTCQSLGWNPGQAEAYFFTVPLSPTTVYIFDENKNLCIQGVVKRTRAIPDPENEGQFISEEFDSWETVETYQGEKYN